MQTHGGATGRHKMEGHKTASHRIWLCLVWSQSQPTKEQPLVCLALAMCCWHGRGGRGVGEQSNGLWEFFLLAGQSCVQLPYQPYRFSSWEQRDILTTPTPPLEPLSHGWKAFRRQLLVGKTPEHKSTDRLTPVSQPPYSFTVCIRKKRTGLVCVPV